MGTELQAFRDIENRLKGLGSEQLTGSKKQKLLQQLDEKYKNIQNARDEFIQKTNDASPDVKEHFQTVYQKTFGEHYFDLVKSRFDMMSASRVDSEQRTSKVLEQNEPKDTPEEHMDEMHGNVQNLIDKFEKISTDAKDSAKNKSKRPRNSKRKGRKKILGK